MKAQFYFYFCFGKGKKNCRKACGHLNHCLFSLLPENLAQARSATPLPLPLPPSWGPQPLPMIVTFRLDFCLSLSLFGEERRLISRTAAGNRAYKVTSFFVMVFSVHAQKVTQTKESWNNDLAVEVYLTFMTLVLPF